MKRKVLEIKKKILSILKERGEIALKALEIKTNIGSQTIKNQIEELEFFGLVEIIKHKKNEKTGRPYTSIRLKQK